jgi:phosphatidylethanolamine/phosphatidyl-N-methylethanolamine N-methyltransferase
VSNATLNDLDGATVDRAYRFWAPIYDLVYGAVLEGAQQASAKAARSVGGRILEIGIGTGLSLSHYQNAPIQLHGIDLCANMLAMARKKLALTAHPHVEELRVMDAHKLAYPDGFFDCTVAQFVLTLVERPEQVLSECARVTRKGGEIILMNHFYSERGFAAAVERLIAPPLRPFGLRPEFPIARLQQWADRESQAQLIDTRKVGLFGSYTLVRFRRV